MVKSIGQPLHSIELAVTEGENWVEPEELSSDYNEAKEQLNKMKVGRILAPTLRMKKFSLCSSSSLQEGMLGMKCLLYFCSCLCLSSKHSTRDRRKF